MISICIPVFNFDVTELVTELLRQSSRLNYPVEVIIFDDHSQQYFRNRNALLAVNSNVHYLDFDFNIGRSKIRNRLGDIAKGEWLLFLDCDVLIDDPDYLERYIKNLSGAKVICGGRKYGSRPFRSELLLRWKYGIKRECRSALSRRHHPYSSFVSGNFIIESSTFQKIRFNEELSGYGHEDTLFGIDLKRHEVEILHIDNPTVHLGLDPYDIFLKKTEQGMENLAKILRITPHMRNEIEQSITLLRLFRTIRRFGLLYPFRGAAKFLGPIIRKNLQGRSPLVIAMDFYKLSLLSKIYNKNWQA